MRKENISISSALENDFICMLSILVLSTLLMWKQLVIPGYFSVMINDAHSYSSWAWQFSEALKEGVLVPKWMPLDMWGYGSPTFIIYPPLSFYMTAFFSLFTASITTAMNICIFVAMFFSGVGIFYLVREFYDNKTGMLAALFNLLLPYNILQFYLMGSFSSKISYMWFAPVVLFTYLYWKNCRLKDLVFASICYCGLICSHIINAYMFTFILFAFIIFITWGGKNGKEILRVSFVIPVGMMLSAVYILPLDLEKHLINLQGFFTKGSGVFYGNHFILPDRTGEVPPNLFWPVYYKFFIIIVLLFAVAIVVFYAPVLLKRRRGDDPEKNRLAAFFFFTASASIFLLFGPSAFVWENVPFFKYIHFPVRWLNIAAFSVTLMFASFSHILSGKDKSGKIFHIFAAILFFTFIYLDCHFIYHSSIFSERELVPLRAEYSSTDHQLPWVDVKLLDKKSGYAKKLDIVEGMGRAKAVVWKSTEREIDAETENPAVLGIRTFNFPGWKAYLDGRPVKIRTEDGTGIILIDVPKGTHKIKLEFVDTPARFIGKIITLFSFAALLAVSLLNRALLGRRYP